MDVLTILVLLCVANFAMLFYVLYTFKSNHISPFDTRLSRTYKHAELEAEEIINQAAEQAEKLLRSTSQYSATVDKKSDELSQTISEELRLKLESLVSNQTSQTSKDLEVLSKDFERDLSKEQAQMVEAMGVSIQATSKRIEEQFEKSFQLLLAESKVEFQNKLKPYLSLYLQKSLSMPDHETIVLKAISTRSNE